MRYTIGTGFWGGGDSGWGANPNSKAAFFSNYWWPNTHKYAAPAQVVVINPGSPPQSLPQSKQGLWIDCAGNLGHVFSWSKFISDRPQPWFLGYTHSWLTSMLVSYGNQTDYIYKEQDCLAFGPWVEQIYKEARDTGKKMLFAHNGLPGFTDIENSLFWCAWDYIPHFITAYLRMSKDINDIKMFPEEKTLRVLKADQANIGYYSFGFGRTRPPQPLGEDKPWFIQQITEHEIEVLKSYRLL